MILRRLTFSPHFPQIFGRRDTAFEPRLRFPVSADRNEHFWNPPARLSV